MLLGGTHSHTFTQIKNHENDLNILLHRFLLLNTVAMIIIACSFLQSCITYRPLLKDGSTTPDYAQLTSKLDKGDNIRFSLVSGEKVDMFKVTKIDSTWIWGTSIR